MTPSEYADEELAIWERALKEQRDAEAALATAQKSRKRELISELMPTVDLLRTKADLLLADAVKLMCLFRDQSNPSGWLTTGPDHTLDGEVDGERSAGDSEQVDRTSR